MITMIMIWLTSLKKVRKCLKKERAYPPPMMTRLMIKEKKMKHIQRKKRRTFSSSSSSSTSSSTSTSSDTNKTTKKKKKKNSPATKLTPNNWPKEVWDSIQSKLEKNLNSNGTPYYKEFSEPGKPDFIDECFHPSGSERIRTSCLSPDEKDSNDPSDNGIREFAVAMHRAMKFIEARKQGKDISKLTSSMQCSHICLNSINVTGSSAKNCCNPTHMLWEDDKTNKTRQRCLGWIWIYPNIHNNNPGNFWYPVCMHDPMCKRWTPKTKMPSYKEKDE